MPIVHLSMLDLLLFNAVGGIAAGRLFFDLVMYDTCIVLFGAISSAQLLFYADYQD